jgi:hypothetical protein
MSYEKPKGLTLKEGQTWNVQHGYVATDAALCDKDALRAAFEASDVKELRKWVRQQSVAGVAVPSYPTCMAWIKGKKDSAGASTQARPSNASSWTGLSLEAEFEAQYAAERDQKLLAFLEGKVQELDTQLKVAQGAVRDQKVKMGLIDPSIDE